MVHEKHFSLEEAQSLVKKIDPLLKKMIDLKDALDRIGYDIRKHPSFGGTGTNGTGKYPYEIGELIKIISKFSDQGILIRALDNGLIDFPHIRSDGNEVYLCYLQGEETIQYWHEIEDGFKGRRNIDEL